VLTSTGNRSPLADVKMKGMFTGLTLDSGVNDLAVKFHVTLEVGLFWRGNVDSVTERRDMHRPSHCKLDISWTR
jgi:ribulose kinase